MSQSAEFSRTQSSSTKRCSTTSRSKSAPPSSGQTNQPKQATTSHNPPLSLKKRIQGTLTSLYAVDKQLFDYVPKRFEPQFRRVIQTPTAISIQRTTLLGIGAKLQRPLELAWIAAAIENPAVKPRDPSESQASNGGRRPHSSSLRYRPRRAACGRLEPHRRLCPGR